MINCVIFIPKNTILEYNILVIIRYKILKSQKHNVDQKKSYDKILYKSSKETFIKMFIEVMPAMDAARLKGNMKAAF